MGEKLQIKIYNEAGSDPEKNMRFVNRFLEDLAESGATDISVKSCATTTFPSRCFMGKKLEPVPVQNYDIVITYKTSSWG
jgi:hypothetical protein